VSTTVLVAAQAHESSVLSFASRSGSRSLRSRNSRIFEDPRQVDHDKDGRRRPGAYSPAPALANVKDATRLLATGDRVRLDASAGIVQRCP
jgi:hypothetical protein